MSEETVRFGLLCSMFQAMLRDRTAAKKRKRLRTFLDRVYTSREYFSAVRLILPSLDRERGTYGLKESALAACLVDALGISKDSDDARRLTNWRKGGARSGANAGNFALVAAEVLQRRQGMSSGGLTIKELNDVLDQLASKVNRGEKTDVLSDLIKKTNALEMKWILMIILKDLKLGISEKSIFHEFHPDAEDLFNVTCDLKLVCEKLKDRSQRHKRQDIEVGKAVRPQLAARVSDATTAWKKLHGKNVVVECKFDGDRIQIHKNGAEIHFFSRNFIDHAEYAHGMSNIILQNVLVDRCILDGEMLVWDTLANRFAEFGSNQEIAKAAREGLESDRQLCCILIISADIAFDILYVGDTSVIHQSLTERHDLLRRSVKPMKGRLEILIPEGGLNDHRPPGEPCWSTIAYTLDDVEFFFKETIENRDEGVVLKDLGSKWEPGDRSGKWLKLKPDYIHAGTDLDVLIIGGYFGSGRHGGEIAQFLVGLAEQKDADSYPKRFVSFCRVGTGLSDEELDVLITKLKPYFRKNDNPKKAPRFYEVTYNSKERPDVWIDSPDKSVIVSITSDIRTIKSEVFAAPYGLRFPRIQRVRYDKPWHECLDLQSFVDLVLASNGNTQRGADHGGLQNPNSKRVRSTKREEKKSASVVPVHLTQTDVSGVKGASLIFANMMFYFVNVPSSYSLDYFHKLVAEHGGSFSMNLNDSVTHCIAAEKKGIKYQAAIRHGDVICCTWILDCCTKKCLLHLQPKYFLFLADSSKSKFQKEIDKFSDYYYWDVDITDIKQILNNTGGAENLQLIEHYKKKYCPAEAFCFFQGSRIYFYDAITLKNLDWNLISELALMRMRLEVTMHGGEVCSSLPYATHLVIYSTLGSHNFDAMYKRFPSSQKHLLHDKRLFVVAHQWLDESVKKGKKLPEDNYNLKPDNLEELEIEPSMQDTGISVAASGPEKDLGSDDRVEKRKRGRPMHTGTRRGRPAPNPARKTKTRPRLGNRPAKLGSDESENNGVSDESNTREPSELVKESQCEYKDESTMIDVGDQEGSCAEHLTETDNKRKRGRPVHTSKKGGRPAAKPAQRTRARVGNRRAKLDLDGSGNSGFSDDSNKREPLGLSKGSHHDVKDEEGSSTMHFTETDSKMEACKDQHDEEHYPMNVMEAGDKGTGNKLEQMVDPLHAMLLDMVPALSQNKVETEKSVPESGKQQPNSDANPVKKKVSYKDVAGQLLKDW